MEGVLVGVEGRRGEMGKGGELWDDSALLKAFDNAMVKYKKMHSKKDDDSRAGGENDIGHASDNNPENQEDSRLAEAEENNLNTEIEISEAKMVTKKVSFNDSHPPESNVESSNGPMLDSIQDGLYSQGAEDYNQLLSQYYELEEKRQQMLQQLNQIGSWNYQYSAHDPNSDAQWGTCSTSQNQYPLPEAKASHPVVVSSCCPYACPCLAAPCTACPSCSPESACIGKTSTGIHTSLGYGTSPSVFDNDIVETAMAAAERAISSMQSKTSIDSNVNEDGEKKKETEGNMGQNITTETDLTVVLNAWYSAGFYTGKYLTEQSIGKKRHP